MKWTYKVADGKMTVTDHNGNQVTSDSNGGSGHVLPDDVLEVMFNEARAQYRMGNTRKSLELVGMMAGEQIREDRS